MRRTFGPQRVVIAIALMLMVSSRTLLSPNLFEFFSAGEIAAAWAAYLLELVPITLALLLGYGVADAVLPPQRPWPVMAALCAWMLAVAIATAWAYLMLLQGGSGYLPSRWTVGSQALLFSVPPMFCAVIAELDSRRRHLEAQAIEALETHERLSREETEQRLQLLQAQIEPHFLFNTLANLRRLYRTDPGSGASMIDSLMQYLRAALPTSRRVDATWADEVALVRAYLDLFRVRMGSRLTFAIAIDPALLALRFPPMLLLTLVENAIKHGIDPRPEGGRIEVRARRGRAGLHVDVVDDGVGFGVAATGGTGVGLANVRRRLAALHGDQAGLDLQALPGGGVLARVRIPADAPQAAMEPAA